MAIEYAGVDLLLEDPGREFQTWLERSLSLNDLRLWGAEPVSYRDGRDVPQGDDRPLVGQPLINWPEPPGWKLNTLWVPTGASRWAFGIFLVNKAKLEEIEYALGGVGFGTLKLREQNETGEAADATTIQGRYWMLPPRMVFNKDGEEAHLLILVDWRYFWQFKDTDELLVEDSTSWTDVLAVLSAATSQNVGGASMDFDTPADAYLQPDTDEVTRHSENLAATIDAVAACLGWRVIFNAGTGVTTMQGSAAALAAVTANHVNEKNLLLAGGEPTQQWNTWPRQVRLVFREEVGGSITGGVYYVSANTTPDSSGELMPTGTEVTFHNTCHAVRLLPDSTPSNLEELTTLTNKIAADYSAWRSQSYDKTIHGLADWTLNGYDDYIWYHAGFQYPKDDETDLPPGIGDPKFGGMFGGNDYAFFTRVCSWPHNVGVAELLHRFFEQESSSSSATSSSSSSSATSSSSQTSSSSVTSSSSSATPGAGECIFYGPTAFRTDDDITLPIFQLEARIVDGEIVLNCHQIGEDDIDVCGGCV